MDRGDASSKIAILHAIKPCRPNHTGKRFLIRKLADAFDQIAIGIRSAQLGSSALLVQGSSVTKLDTMFGYTAWHPSGRIVAYSANKVRQFFHWARGEVRDVVDLDSGLAYYDVRAQTAKTHPSISDPDRLWLTLASYNVGFGHLEDARILTQRQGGDPDRWQDVKEHLPLLSKKEHYSTVKHGYARGWEPVRYVENIRSYYDILVWMDEQQKPANELPKALAVDSPSL